MTDLFSPLFTFGSGASRSVSTRPTSAAALATGGTIVKIPEGLDSLSFYGAGMVKKKHKFRKREALNRYE